MRNFDDFDLFETCEEYYNSFDETNLSFEFNLPKEDKEELDKLFN